jgi:hypothetical protein
VECPRAFLERLKDGTVDLKQSTGTEIEAKLAEFVAKSYKERALNAVVRILVAQGIEEGWQRKIRNALNNDREFTDAVRRGKA